MTRYTMASSFVCNGSFEWITKKAIPIVNIRGIRENLVNNPAIKKVEAKNSAPIANISEVFIPTPNGSGKPPDITSKFCNFPQPWVIIKNPIDTLKKRSAAEFALSPAGLPSKKKSFIAHCFIIIGSSIFSICSKAAPITSSTTPPYSLAIIPAFRREIFVSPSNVS